jgi:uncharacterized protein YhaN
MMPIPQDVDTNKELIALILLVISGWIGLGIKAVVDTRLNRRTAQESSETRKKVGEIGEVVDAVQGQVVNGHADAPPLRADLDRVIAGVELLGEKLSGLTSLVLSHGDDIRGMRKDMSELRGEFRDTRSQQTDFEGRVQSFVKREYPDAKPI